MIGASATPQSGGWLRNPRSLGVSLPVTELRPALPLRRAFSRSLETRAARIVGYRGAKMPTEASR
jgi:hypothetical protein